MDLVHTQTSIPVSRVRRSGPQKVMGHIVVGLMRNAR